MWLFWKWQVGPKCLPIFSLLTSLTLLFNLSKALTPENYTSILKAMPPRKPGRLPADTLFSLCLAKSNNPLSSSTLRQKNYWGFPLFSDCTCNGSQWVHPISQPPRPAGIHWEHTSWAGQGTEELLRLLSSTYIESPNLFSSTTTEHHTLKIQREKKIKIKRQNTHSMKTSPKIGT